MTELLFRLDLYDEQAVEHATRVFAEYADIELQRSEQALVVRISAESLERERLLAGELGNYALGATVDGVGEEVE